MSSTTSRVLLLAKSTSSDMGFGTSYLVSGMSFGLMGKTLNLYSDRTWEVVTKKGLLSASGDVLGIQGVKKVGDGLEITFTNEDGKRWLRTTESDGLLPWMGNKRALESLEGILEYWSEGDHSILVAEQSAISSPVKYLGGTGSSLNPGCSGALWITASGFAIKSDNNFWSRSVGAVVGLQIGGQGIYTTGGGWVGGGVGFNGAMQGAAMASMLNALETRVHNDCLMRLCFEDAELNFQILDVTPRDLELKLSPIRLHLERQLGVSSSSTMGLSGTVGIPSKSSSKDLKTKLQEIKQAFEAGLLTKDEYEAKRSGLLENL